MQDGRPHPLLAQIPLTVSPFISLPTAPTLPYTYKSLPSTLPPSSTGGESSDITDKPRYVVSQSGHAAHPDEIIASCRALQTHLQKMQDDAEKTVSEWEASIRERELAEKRRVAPGWLDREEKILEPAKRNAVVPAGLAGGVAAATEANVSIMDSQAGMESSLQSHVGDEQNPEGAALDRAFGSMGIR